MSREKQKARPLLEELEPRILHSADVAALVPTPAIAQLVEMRVVETAPVPVADNAAAAQISESPREIVIVDSAVQDYQSLIDDLQRSRDANLAVYVLDAGADGVAQISDILASEHDLQAVHLISHGGDGEVRLGAGVLDRETLARDAEEISGWARALTADADLLIYGCDVAAGPDGRAFVDALAAMTGADVAASTDLTGSPVKGGDWALEYAAGRIDEAALAPAAAGLWSGILAGNEAPVITDHALSFDGTDAVVAPASPSLTMTSTMTLEATIQRTGPLPGSNNQIILNKEGEYELGIAPDGHLQWAFASTTPGWTWVDTGYVVPADTWVHLAVTYNDGVVNTYVEGTLVHTDNGTGPIGDQHPASNDFTIGSRQDAQDQHFTGLIDEVRVWNVERSAAEILATYRTPLAGNEAGLAGYWRFDETSGTTAVDSSPNGNNGVLGNGVAADEPARTTNLDYAATEDTPLVVAAPGVLAFATDAEGLPVTAALVTGPAHAAAFTLNADGSFSYTPTADYSGADLFTFRASDGTVDSDPVTVRLTVAAVNDPPARTAGTVNDLTVLEDATATSLGLGTLAYSTGGGADEAAQTLTYTVTAVPAAALGTVTLADGTTAVTASTSYTLVQLQGMQFTAAAGASGGPATFSWSVVDNAGGADTLLESLTISVTSVNDAPAGADKTVTTLEDTAYTFTVADFGLTDANDTPANALLAVKIGALPGAGSLTLSGAAVGAGQSIIAADITAGNFRFTPAANANGAAHATFTFQVQDDGGVANGGVDLDPTLRTMTIDVTAVNDAPVLVGTNDLGGINRNPTSNPGTLVADLLASHVTDADSADLAGIAVTAVDNTNGAWEYSTNGGSTWTAFGSPTAGTARLLAADISTYVRFVPNTNFSGTVANGLTFKAWDQTSGAAGATADATVGGGATAFSTASASASIMVTATNTAPTLTGSNNLTAINEDAIGNAGTLVSSLIATMTSDVDPGALTGVAVTAVDNTNGTWQYSLNSGSSWTSFGAPSATSARLLAADANTFVRFVPNANFNGTASNGITFRAWDRSTGVNGGTADTSGLAGTFRDDFSTASYNNNNGTLAWSGPWVETDSSGGGGAGSGRFQITIGTLAMQVANPGDNIFREANLSNATGASLSFTYFSGLKNSARIEVQMSSDGGSNYTTLAGGVFDSSTNSFGGTRTFDITSSISANTRVRFLVVNGEPSSGDNAFLLGDLQITAIGHNGGSTAFSTATASASVTVNAVNDAPVRTAGAVNNLTVLEDAPATSLGLGTLAYGTGGGADEALQTFTYTVTGVPAAALGTVTLADGTTAVTASTSYTLAQLQGMQFKAALNGNGGPATFSWTVADSGGTANGGVDTLNQSLTISVTSVNDAPAGNNRTVTMFEDTTYTIPLTDFGYTDGLDMPPNALLNVKIGAVPVVGSLTLSGVAVTAGQSISGASIAAGNLKFTPVANANGMGYASFTFRVQDDAGVANGGADTDSVARTFTFDVTPVSDAPAGTNKTVTTFEDTTYTFGIPDFGFSDTADGNALTGVKIASLPAAGSLTLAGIAVTANQTVSAAAITAGSLKFTPVPNANGAAYATFTFQVQDNGGVANGGADLDPTPRTMTVAVTPVNDAPSGTSHTVSTLEDTAYTFTAADFGFSDALDGNALANVKIASLPAAGTLTLSGVAVGAGQSVSAANIGAGALKFTPLADANGAAYASFTFQVQDNGGVANGGIDLDPTPRTMTIDVTAVNDAPTLTSGAVVTLAATNEDSPSTATSVSAILAGAASGDVDAGATSGIAITAASGNGVWQYSTDGLAWQRFGTVSSTSALLLSSGTQVRYLPDGVNGETASFAFRAWDRTTGAASTNGVQAYANPGVGGGATAYSAAAASASLTVAGINDAPTVADRALAFDGTDLIVVPGNPSLVMTSTLTLEADIQRTGPLGPARQMILNKEGEYELAVSPNGKLAWAFAGTTPGWTWIETGLTIPADTWIHIAVTYDNGVVKTYANGALVDTNQGTGPIGDVTPLLNDFTIAGRQSNGEQRFVGLIDEVRVWNVARSGAEIAATSQTTLTGSEAGLVAYWRFDETSGTVAIDSSGHGNDGTLGNGVAVDVPTRTTNLDYMVVEDNALAVGGPGVLARATDPEGAALSASLVTGPAHASAFTLNADGSFSYTPTADFNGSDSFVFAASDGALSSRSVTVRFTVSAANDAPTLANGTLAATIEDTGAPSGAPVSTIFAGAFADVDAGAAFTGVAVVGNGANASTQGVWQYSSDAGATWFAIGSVGDGPGALALSGSTLLRFAPAAEFNGVPGPLTVRGLDDTYLGGFSDTLGVETRVTVDTTVAGGTTAIATATATVNTSVTAVNDAPAGADHTVVALEDTAYTFSAADFGFSDPRDGNALSSVRIATLPSVGTLMLSGVAVSVDQAVSAASIAAGNLSFSPGANANGAGVATFTFRVQDDGGTANGGIDLDPVAHTLTVDIAAVNDAPTGANHTVTTLEDTAYVFAVADFGFADAMEGNGLLAVRIAALPANGSLTLNGAAVTANQSVLAVSIAAGDLRFVPAADANGAAYASFTFQVQDDGGVANGGIDLDPVARTMSVDVIAVSDAPAGANHAVTTLEDAPYTFGVTDFGFADTADSNALANVKIAALPGAGTLTLGGVAVTANQFVSVASIAAGDLRYTPAADANGAAYASFTFQVQDDGGSANGGADLDPTPRTMTIAVTPVNDAPAGTDRTVTTLEDTPYTFAAADFGFSDADGADALLAVRIGAAPTTGTLAYDFVPVVAGQVVTAVDIAAGKLMFIPALDGNATPYASFTFQVQDDGGVANGGVDLDPTSRTMTIAVTPVNDAPSGTSNTVATLEDSPYVFTAADFGFSDARDSNALMDVKIASLPAAGTLTLAGVTITANQFVSAASIAAGDLRFTPAPDASAAAYASFTFQVRDDGGTVNSGIDLDPVARAMTVAVTAVNDAPTGADRTVATLEDTAYRFGLADFGFSDALDGNAIAAVKIVGVPGAGALTLAGVAVTAGQTVSAASIAAGDLRFTPAANDNGAAYASFGFQVQDDGGTVNGGVDTDPVTRTMTIDVASVNDVPSGADRTVTIGAGVDYTFAAGDFGFSDAADRSANALLDVKIVSVSGAGTLTVGGAQVTAGQVITAVRISAGDLKFAPGANGSGVGYAIVTFQVQDDGGTAVGGADTDPAVRTLTVDVQPRTAVAVPDASLAVTDVPPAPPAPPPAPTQVAQAEEAAAESAAADSRAKATLARITAELNGAIARTQSAPAVDAGAEVLAPPPTPELRTDAAASSAPTSSASARRDAGNAGAVVTPVLFEMRTESVAPPPIALSLSTGSRSAAATTTSAADPRSQEDDAKHQAYALLTMENGVRASAIIVSAGMVTWTLHGAGLIASLLTSAPAWRHLDPLPVLAPETEKPDWGESDGDSQREEDAADRLWLGSSQRPARPL